MSRSEGGGHCSFAGDNHHVEVLLSIALCNVMASTMRDLSRGLAQFDADVVARTQSEAETA